MTLSSNNKVSISQCPKRTASASRSPFRNTPLLLALSSKSHIPLTFADAKKMNATISQKLVPKEDFDAFKTNSFIPFTKEMRTELGGLAKSSDVQMLKNQLDMLKEDVCLVRTRTAEFAKRIEGLLVTGATMLMHIEKKNDDLRIGLEKKIEDLRIGLEKKVEDLRIGLEKKIDDLGNNTRIFSFSFLFAIVGGAWCLSEKTDGVRKELSEKIEKNSEKSDGQYKEMLEKIDKFFDKMLIWIAACCLLVFFKTN